MKRRIILLITALIISLNVSAQLDRSIQPKGGPTPKIKLEKPEEFKLKNGIKVLVVENHKLPRVSYSLRIDNNPIIEGEKAGITSLLGSILGNGTTTISKDDFNEEIDFLGASLNIGFSGGFASTLTKNNERVVELMADAVINPLLSEEEFDKEKNKIKIKIKKLNDFYNYVLFFSMRNFYLIVFIKITLINYFFLISYNFVINF